MVVAKVPAGEILFTNRHAERAVGRPLSEIAHELPMFHPGGRPYAFAERQVPRPHSSGEEISILSMLGVHGARAAPRPDDVAWRGTREMDARWQLRNDYVALTSGSTSP